LTSFCDFRLIFIKTAQQAAHILALSRESTTSYEDERDERRRSPYQLALASYLDALQAPKALWTNLFLSPAQSSSSLKKLFPL
jgi:hypothetical protein